MNEEVKSAEMEIQPGSGNVFADLGLENATELMMKAEIRYKSQVEKTKSNQTGTKLKLKQSKLSTSFRARLLTFLDNLSGIYRKRKRRN